MSAVVKFNIPAIEAAVRQGVSDGLASVAIKLQKGIKRNLNNSYGGIRLRLDGKRRRLRGKGAVSSRRYPSPPGMPPAWQSGNLSRSWQAFKPHAVGPKIVRVVVASDRRFAHYAAWLEYGTRRMAARPYVRPVLNQQRGAIAHEINASVARALRRFRA